VAAARNKHLTRQACLRAGVPTPRFARITGPADLAAAAAHVGFPAILKPVAGAASASACRVEDEQALRRRYGGIMAALDGRLKASGIHSDDERELVWATGREMVLEEYLDGEEFDVDCLLSEGALVYAGVTHDWPQPHCKEVGAEIPPLLPAARQRELVALAERVLGVLGFADGVFHVEVKDTRAGPRLIEVNARMGGGPRHRMNKLVWGVDLIEQYLMTVLGLPIRPRQAAQPLVSLAHFFFPAPHSGRVARADFLAPIGCDPRVVHCQGFIDAGQQVAGPEGGPPDWLGDLLVRGESPEAAIRTLEELRGRVDVPIVPDPCD
jgi:carnosine synthase